MNYEYDIFVGGPWEKHAPFPYKSMIKDAFPDKRIFDPEERASQRTGDWFVDNYRGLRDSRTMAALVPYFPLPGVGPEIGIFYYTHAKTIGKPLEELAIIWPEVVKPDYGKKVAEKMGCIVKDPEQAISRLKAVLS